MVKLIRTRYVSQFDHNIPWKQLKLIGKYNLNKHKLSRVDMDVIRDDINYTRRLLRDSPNLRYDVVYKNILFTNRSRAFVLRLMKGTKTNFNTDHNMISVIQEAREQAKDRRITAKRFAHYVYEMIGGVIVSMERVSSRITKPYNNHNHVAIELEFISKDVSTLNSLLYGSMYGKYVELKNDGSLRTDERGGEPLELVICCPENNVKEVVSDIVDRVNLVGGYVNSSCGLHVHLDARTRDPSTMYSNLFKARKLLSSLVPEPRRKNRYCKMNTRSTFSDALTEGERYRAINPQSFNRHKTIEVRLHHGTLNKNTILNWVTLLLKIVEGTNVKKDTTVSKIVEIKKNNVTLHTLNNDHEITEEAV